jgi:hypothetical protein
LSAPAYPDQLQKKTATLGSNDSLTRHPFEP